MKKYVIEIPNNVLQADSFRDAINIAKANQPSTILRGTYVITHFPWPGENKQ